MSPSQWAFLPLEKYATFSGRASRSEYWWFYLFQTLIGMIAMIIDSLLGLSTQNSPVTTHLIVSLALFLPILAVTVRRFHDINRSGWTVVTTMIPLIVAVPIGAVMMAFSVALGALIIGGTAIVVVVRYLGYMITEGNPGDNNYGPDPFGRRYGY